MQDVKVLRVTEFRYLGGNKIEVTKRITAG